MSDETMGDLVRSFKKATDRTLLHDIEQVVKKGAVNVKRSWRDNAKATAGPHARAYPYSVTFDAVVRHGWTVSVEVGPDKSKRQGALGNLLEYGSVHNPPHLDGKRAVDAEVKGFTEAISKVAARRWARK